MEELDFLKKNWKKNENSFEQVSEIAIYRMIHKKSSSIVKWILIISILEFIFWNAISLFFVNEDYIKRKYSKNIVEYIIEINTICNIINYVVILIFIYFFYKNYRAISSDTSTSQLMKNIIKTRKTVHYYVWFNILFLIFGTLIILYVQFMYDSRLVIIKDKILNSSSNLPMIKSLLFLTIILLIGVGIIWLFYRLLYGILLRKLYRNYNELKKIDL